MWIRSTIQTITFWGIRLSHSYHGNTFLIGIGGTTNGGKTSLVNRISKDFPKSECIHMDDYFLPQDKIPFVEELGYKNYDAIYAIDFQKLFHNVCLWRKQHSNTKKCNVPSILFVEGILVLNHEPLTRIFDMKFYMTISYEECIKRRMRRKYPTPDPHGYFDDCLWPMYLRYKNSIKDDRDVIDIDGEIISEKIDIFVTNKILSVITEKYDDD